MAQFRRFTPSRRHPHRCGKEHDLLWRIDGRGRTLLGVLCGEKFCYVNEETLSDEQRAHLQTLRAAAT